MAGGGMRETLRRMSPCEKDRMPGEAESEAGLKETTGKPVVLHSGQGQEWNLCLADSYSPL